MFPWIHLFHYSLELITYLACEGARLAANLSEASRLQEPTRLLELNRTLESDPLAQPKMILSFTAHFVLPHRFGQQFGSAIFDTSLEQLMVQFPVAVVPDAYFQKCPRCWTVLLLATIKMRSLA